MLTKINPALAKPPMGYQRIKRGVPLQQGDLYFHPVLLIWAMVSSEVKTNNYTNCVRPIEKFDPLRQIDLMVGPADYITGGS